MGETCRFPAKAPQKPWKHAGFRPGSPPETFGNYRFPASDTLNTLDKFSFPASGPLKKRRNVQIPVLDSSKHHWKNANTKHVLSSQHGCSSQPCTPDYL